MGKGEFIFAGKEAFFGDIGPLFAIPSCITWISLIIRYAIKALIIPTAPIPMYLPGRHALPSALVITETAHSQ